MSTLQIIPATNDARFESLTFEEVDPDTVHLKDGVLSFEQGETHMCGVPIQNVLMWVIEDA